ncbi:MULTISPECIES: hypothetical protein [Kitasatospora]|uniref:DUF2569 family protein n=2 Tax=Kitasatospora TaxID=2063 RepID=A0ABT1J8G2_9ACTN|nr:hypothetical protein [Kitasatospora paracochleata]MCP2313725.1 hypothetical protein [Kitasatospora paracochleata]
MIVFSARVAAIGLALETLALCLVQVGVAVFDLLGCDQPWEEQPTCAEAGAGLGLWLLLGALHLWIAALWFRQDRAPRRGVRVLMAWVVLVQLAAVRELLDPVARPVGGEWIEGVAVLAGIAYITATAVLTMVRPERAGPRPGEGGPGTGRGVRRR